MNYILLSNCEHFNKDLDHLLSATSKSKIEENTRATLNMYNSATKSIEISLEYIFPATITKRVLNVQCIYRSNKLSDMIGELSNISLNIHLRFVSTDLKKSKDVYISVNVRGYISCVNTDQSPVSSLSTIKILIFTFIRRPFV